MRLGSFSTLILAALMASPALWAGFVTGRLDATTALLRFLIAVPVAGIMLAVLRAMTAGYRRGHPKPVRATAVTGESPPSRRSNDD